MNDLEGFVIEYRKIMQWEWYTDVNTAHLFRHCILRANYIDMVWRGIKIERGSFITSLQTLSTETGLTVKQVRTALEKLEKTGEVASRATSKYRIITVKNYDLYQSQGKQNGRQNGKQRAYQKASKRQSEGKQRATNNKYISNDIYNKETSGDVRPTGAQSPQEKEKQPPLAAAPLTVAPPQAAEKIKPLEWREWNRYSQSKGYTAVEAEDEWNKRGGKFSEEATAKVRKHNEESAANGEHRIR